MNKHQPKPRKRWVERRLPSLGPVIAEDRLCVESRGRFFEVIRVTRPGGAVVFWPDYWQERLPEVAAARRFNTRARPGAKAA